MRGCFPGEGRCFINKNYRLLGEHRRRWRPPPAGPRRERWGCSSGCGSGRPRSSTGGCGVGGPIHHERAFGQNDGIQPGRHLRGRRADLRGDPERGPGGLQLAGSRSGLARVHDGALHALSGAGARLHVRGHAAGLADRAPPPGPLVSLDARPRQGGQCPHLSGPLRASGAVPHLPGQFRRGRCHRGGGLVALPQTGVPQRRRAGSCRGGRSSRAPGRAEG